MRNLQFASGAPNEVLARTADDARADGGHRMILLAPRWVTIRRRLRGVKMQLRVPVESYTGVVLSRDEDHQSGALFSVRLWHRDPELSVTLRASNNRGASIEAWHQWAAYFAMPALIDGAGHQCELADAPPPGSTPAIPVLPRRRTGPVSNRKQRLALCRRTASPCENPKIFRGERVIISHE